jgi:hypothetical protein
MLSGKRDSCLATGTSSEITTSPFIVMLLMVIDLLQANILLLERQALLGQAVAAKMKSVQKTSEPFLDWPSHFRIQRSKENLPVLVLLSFLHQLLIEDNCNRQKRRKLLPRRRRLQRRGFSGRRKSHQRGKSEKTLLVTQIASLSRVRIPIMTMKLKIQNVYSVQVVFPTTNMARNGCNVFGVIVGLMKIVGLKKTILCALIV